MNGPQPDPGKRFTGGVLIAVGGMIFLMCGLCTASFVGAGLAGLSVGPAASGPDRYEAGWSVAFMFLTPVVGGIPTIIGAALVALGVSELRGRRSLGRDKVIGGSVLMAASTAVAWVVGGVLVVLILDAIKHPPSAGASFDQLILIGIAMTAVVLTALALFWKGLKMVRGRASRFGGRRPGSRD